VNNINVTNNYGNKTTCNVVLTLRDVHEIFEDKKLNKLMIDSLYENANNAIIAEAIAHTNNDKICFVANARYRFNGAIGKFV
jgi:hypothetical protein